MRQRLFKAIYCVALMVSVFLLNFSTAFADDYDVQLGLSCSAYYRVNFTCDLNESGQSYYGYGEMDVSSRYNVALKGGYVYNGYLQRDIMLTENGKSSSVTYSSLNLKDMSVPSPIDGLTITLQFRYAGGTSSPNRIVVRMYFVDVYVPYDMDLSGSFSAILAQRCTFSKSVNVTDANYSFSTTLASDTAGKLDASLPSEVNLGGVVADSAYQQMQQQQQIANQQSQQSEQQHNSLINGYDNAANDTMLADKNSVLKGFEQQQDQAMSDGQQYVADFSANYDTAPLVAMAPAFMMISTWFNDLWGGMGNFSTVLIVGLMLCVAGYILKLKH